MVGDRASARLAPRAVTRQSVTIQLSCHMIHVGRDSGIAHTERALGESTPMDVLAMLVEMWVRVTGYLIALVAEVLGGNWDIVEREIQKRKDEH